MPDAIRDVDWLYVVTDIEVDGPWPGPNSMRSCGAVAVSGNGHEHGTFEAVLEPLPGASVDSKTYAWFQTEPDAWAAATTDPKPVLDVMTAFCSWVQSLPEPRMFAASPLGFDGIWIDYYLRRFTKYGLAQGPLEADRLFDGTGLCIRSYAAAVLGKPMADVTPDSLPAMWLGDVRHTHRASDDARGYANLLGVLFRLSAARHGE